MIAQLDDVGVVSDDFGVKRAEQAARLGDGRGRPIELDPVVAVLGFIRERVVEEAFGVVGDTDNRYRLVADVALQRLVNPRRRVFPHLERIDNSDLTIRADRNYR